MLRNVDYKGVQDVGNVHPGLTNVVRNVPLFSLNEVFYEDKL